MGIRAQLVGTRPIETPDLIADPVAVEGLVYTYPSFNSSHPFVEEYAARYGRLPTVFAAEAYDAITTLAQAASECGIDTACIHGWYRGRAYDGALGHVVFDNNGDAHYPLLLKEVRSGAFVEYQRSE
jgi:ABC-type branched-subunit amino acid transport system substrate-binding protein